MYSDITTLYVSQVGSINWGDWFGHGGGGAKGAGGAGVLRGAVPLGFGRVCYYWFLY